jgi:hypothetical protein
VVFVIAMLAGMELCERFFSNHKNKPTQAWASLI